MALHQIRWETRISCTGPVQVLHRRYSPPLLTPPVAPLCLSLHIFLISLSDTVLQYFTSSVCVPSFQVPRFALHLIAFRQISKNPTKFRSTNNAPFLVRE